MRIRVVGPHWKNEFQINHFPITVGREGNDLNLEDAHLSRKHALIYRDNAGGVRIADRDTTNGTYVNDVRIEDAPLNIGDVALVGNIQIELVAEQVEGLTGWPEYGNYIAK